MTSILPAPVLSARTYAQTTSWNTHNTSDTWTEEAAEGQGGEVTGLEHPKPERNGAMIQTHHSFQA